MSVKSLRSVIADVASKEGYTLERHARGRGRYEYALLQRDGRPFFVKAGYTRQVDFDEPLLLYNLQREIWWAQVIEALEQSRGKLPFTSPRVVSTNVSRRGCADDVGWIIFTFEEAEALAGASIWEVGRAEKEWDASAVERFRRNIPSLCATLAALDQMTSSVIRPLGIPLKPPHAPHGETSVPREMLQVIRAEKLLPAHEITESVEQLTGYRHIRDVRVLGQGDFEVSHLHLRPDGTVALVDNEFAWWYPRFDSLTYCFHRLWANRRRPDLARALLHAYADQSIPQRKRGTFFTEFYRILLPRTLRGFYYDATRRGLGPFAENQVVRRELLWAILARNWRVLAER